MWTNCTLKSRSEGFGAEVKRRILLGTYTLSAGYFDAYYKKALQVRTLVIRELNAVLKEVRPDLLSPVAPTTAYKIGEKTTSPLEMYLGDIDTVPVNIAGIPALVAALRARPRGAARRRAADGRDLLRTAALPQSAMRWKRRWAKSARRRRCNGLEDDGRI